MSLKAKIEAVIYAAEEPVTLSQITGLFQAELLEEREARTSAEAAAREEFVSEAEVVTQPVLGIPDTEPEEAGDGDAASREPGAVEGEAAAEPSAEDEKKVARQKEREARDEAKRILAPLMAEYSEGDRGIEIREIAGGYRLGTKPEYHDAVRSFVKSLRPPMKLSLQALETLAVIAYKQPITVPEISEIRGVDSSGVLGSLISRKLVTTAGRKQVIGRPILYKTTKEFLLRFGLKDVNELPSMEEFEKMAGELTDTEDDAAEKELPFEGAAGAEPVVEGTSEAAEGEVEPAATELQEKSHEEAAREGANANE
ncbi:MAG TPA: SMC-Scp complex subunit ScpB [Acidobacteriaceae bacterium]|nr:SMC-Scp complex subunit ScpB [Acidobacteriaceae bacterium]